MEYKKEDLKKAYLKGELNEFLDGLMTEYDLTAEDVKAIENDLNEIKEKTKSTRDLVLETFKSDIINIQEADIIDKDFLVEIKKSKQIIGTIEENVRHYLNGDTYTNKQGATCKYTLTPNQANDYALSIIANMTNIELYEEHFAIKYRARKKEIMEKYHLQRKTAEEMAQCESDYMEYNKIHIWRKNLDELVLMLKARCKIFNN